jgi:lysophospholipase-2
VDTPVFLSHSVDDEVVPIENGEKLREALKILGMKVEWHAYENGGHWVNEPKGVEDMAAFLKRIIQSED